jgi:hypothetical protein
MTSEELLSEIAALIEERYVFPDVATRVANELRRTPFIKN